MLQITETELNFVPPIVSTPGTLTSSSGANFTNTLPGDSQRFQSLLNSTPTPQITLSSTGGPPTNNQSGSSPPIGIPALPFYDLGNSVLFSLSAPAGGHSTDAFGVTGAVSVVPEPASMLLFGTGLVALGVKLRRRKSSNLVVD
jgi:hypothetical protein